MTEDKCPGGMHLDMQPMDSDGDMSMVAPHRNCLLPQFTSDTKRLSLLRINVP